MTSMVFMLFLVLISFCGQIFAQEGKKILILNSDKSIEKYLLTQTEFESVLTNPKVEIDLGSKWIDESAAKNTILKENPEVIFCIGSKAYLLVSTWSGNKNIVFSSIINWRRLPMGKNTSGISTELPVGMQLMMYRYFFPDIKNIGVLYSDIYNKEWLESVAEQAKEVGINIVADAVSKPEDVCSNLKKILPRIDAVWLISDPIVISEKESVVEIFKQSKLAKKPVFTYDSVFADFGAALIISADIPTIGRQAAGLVTEMLVHKNIIDRVQDPAGSYITINLKKIEECGIKLNIEALDSVNQIIK